MEDLRKTYRTTVIIGVAMMASLLVYLIVVGLFEQGTVTITTSPLPDNVLQVIKFVLLGLTVVNFFLIRYVGNRILTPGDQKDKRFSLGSTPAGPLVNAAVVTFALCELPAILGLIMYFLGRNTADFYLFLLISLFFFSIHFPRLSQWEEWYRQQRR
jgi:hypothetical protein